MKTIDDLSAKITASYQAMSPGHRKIAAYILDHPDEVAMSSMREIAVHLRLDPSTFVRFAKKFSLSGYAELRNLFRNEMSSAGTGYVERARRLQRKGRKGKVAGLILDMQLSNEANLARLFERNPPQSLQDAADAMIRARHVYIVGLRSYFPAAFALDYACKMVRQNVHLGDGLGGTFAAGMRGIGPSDVFLAIAAHPYSRDTVSAARYAAKRGARIIVLTDSALSRLAEDAEFVLTFSCKGPLILGTVVPAIALVEVLSAVLIARGGQKSMDMLKESDRQLAEFAAYEDIGTAGPKPRSRKIGS